MRRLHNSLRSLALCAAIGIAAFAWRAGVEPAEIQAAIERKPLLDARGRQVEVRMAAVNLWVQLAIMVVSSLISYALAPKPPKPKPAALEDFDIPQAVQGAPFAMIFGECRDTSPVVAWFGNLTSKPIKAKGGKK